MTLLKHKIEQLIAINRQQWLAECVYRYGLKSPEIWRLYGYASYDDYRKDLARSLQQK
ncbi:hypothetical protein ACED51_02730 [Photobacterium swingsii]|uniref:hypothetical protein n=1 Tax=Photobacterium swingsii TaxID=680026 RepID=UPI00352CE852